MRFATQIDGAEGDKHLSGRLKTSSDFSSYFSAFSDPTFLHPPISVFSLITNYFYPVLSPTLLAHKHLVFSSLFLSMAPLLVEDKQRQPQRNHVSVIENTAAIRNVQPCLRSFPQPQGGAGPQVLSDAPDQNSLFFRFSVKVFSQKYSCLPKCNHSIIHFSFFINLKAIWTPNKVLSSAMKRSFYHTESAPWQSVTNTGLLARLALKAETSLQPHHPCRLSHNCLKQHIFLFHSFDYLSSAAI